MVGWKLQERLNTEPQQKPGLGHLNLEYLSLVTCFFIRTPVYSSMMATHDFRSVMTLQSLMMTIAQP